MMEQLSPEWFAARAGRITASRVADVIAKIKTGWGAGRTNYMAQLVAERLTGAVAESYSNAAMDWGRVTEADARSAYSFHTDVDVIEAAFIGHPAIEMSGASPDGLVGDDGLVEIKCPNTATHIDTLLGGSIPGKYVTQMQWQMACTGRAWCDFVSFDPRLGTNLCLFIQRLHRDPATIRDLEREVIIFDGEVAAKVNALLRLPPPMARAA